MVKKCKVLINNSAVTVIDYEGIKVQIPSVGRSADYINIIFENGHYIAVSDDYKEPEIKKTTSKKSKKRAQEPQDEDCVGGVTISCI